MHRLFFKFKCFQITKYDFRTTKGIKALRNYRELEYPSLVKEKKRKKNTVFLKLARQY